MRAAFLLSTLLIFGPAAAQTPRPSTPAPAGGAVAIFAGGCFWSTEAAFEAMPGVTSAVSGYTGGALQRPTYERHAGHVEAVRVAYDPRRVSYRQLTDQFWRTIDPTDPDGVFCDQGPSYHPVVFVSGAGQQREAEQSRAAAQTALGRRVTTPIRTASAFWPAEAYHQDYARRNPARYAMYKVGCGRERALEAVWGRRPS